MNRLFFTLLVVVLIGSCKNKKIDDFVSKHGISSNTEDTEFTEADIKEEKIFSDSTELKTVMAFETFHVDIPNFLKLTDHKISDDPVNDYENITYSSKSGKIFIVIRRQVYLPLLELKSTWRDMISNKERIKKDEIIVINGIETYVHEMQGTTLRTDSNELRYWFWINEKSYSLLMIYPDDAFDKTKKLRERIINSLRIA